MRIVKKRAAGSILGRDGISMRIIKLAEDISQGSYKNAIEKAGQIVMLVDAATFDEYWDEKTGIGKRRECDILYGLIEGDLIRYRVIGFVNPHEPSQDK